MLSDRLPCPVCGHPTGDCKGNGPEPTHVIGPGLFPSLGHESTVIIEKDVYAEKQITPYTKTTVLIARAGTAIPVSLAKRLGIL